MAEAFHGTPITPQSVLTNLGARNYCVSYYRPDQMALVADLALRVMIDNGAFSAWKKGLILDAAYWRRFYEFVALWLPACAPASFFVFPDVIDAGTQEQDALLREAPAELIEWGWPVWHMDEPISRCLRLIETYGRVCIGSTAEYAVVGSASWRTRMDELFNAVLASFGMIPPMHMLRGLQVFLPTFDYPVSQADSTDMARNHNRMGRYGEHREWATRAKCDRWDRLAANNQSTWEPQMRCRERSLFEEFA